ncbi:MAG: flagellar hook assembly protein FlgD [Spirochaetales bacterium]|nr:flagellar hook assembly protein FlgD [Spirochaetales bacterium]
MQVAQANAKLAKSSSALGMDQSVQNVLDKDDFLKILIEQLSNQDPTNPMEDKEFIAQMAQFSTLEQMTNMAGGFTQLAENMKGVSMLLSAGQALNMLGREVQIQTEAGMVNGRVSEVLGNEFPQVLVNGQYYDLASVVRVRE